MTYISFYVSFINGSIHRSHFKEERETIMIYVKQYGMKRSGTNYTRWLVQNNFVDVQPLSEILGWKHGPHPNDVDWTGSSWTDPSHTQEENERQALVAMVTDDLREAVASNNIRYTITTKNPYAWWCSYVRFTERPEPMVSVKDGIKLWNILHENWSCLVQKNPLAIIVRYEDLLLNLDKTMLQIAYKLQLEPKSGDFKDLEVRMARRSDLNWHMGPTTTQFDPSHYTDRKYLEIFDDKLLKTFGQLLAPSVMKRLGYEIIS